MKGYRHAIPPLATAASRVVISSLIHPTERAREAGSSFARIRSPAGLVAGDFLCVLGRREPRGKRRGRFGQRRRLCWCRRDGLWRHGRHGPGWHERRAGLGGTNAGGSHAAGIAGRLRRNQRDRRVGVQRQAERFGRNGRVDRNRRRKRFGRNDRRRTRRDWRRSRCGSRRRNELRRQRWRQSRGGGQSGNRRHGRRGRNVQRRGHEWDSRRRRRHRPLRHLSSREHAVRGGSQHGSRPLLHVRRKSVSAQARVGQDHEGRPGAGPRGLREHLGARHVLQRHHLHHLDPLRPVRQQERPWKSPVAYWLKNGGNEANAADGKTMVAGHVVHGIYVTGYSSNVAYRNNATKGVREGRSSRSDVHGRRRKALQQISAASTTAMQRRPARTTATARWRPSTGAHDITWGGKGEGNGPWVAADLENGVFKGDKGGWQSQSISTPNAKSVIACYATAMLKGPSGNHFTLKAGDAQSGTLAKMWDGVRPSPGYSPKKLQGAIILGTGGDGSNGGDRNLLRRRDDERQPARCDRRFDPGEHRRRRLRSADARRVRQPRRLASAVGAAPTETHRSMIRILYRAYGSRS